MLHTCCLHKGLVRKENCIGTESCKNQLAIVDHFTIDCLNYAGQIMNFKVFNFIIPDTQDNASAATPLISRDHNALVQYSNAIYIKAGVEKSYTRMIADQQKRAIDLIALLKKEYHLENE